MVIISCLPIPAAEAQQTRLEFQILFSSPWYPAHGSPKVLKDFWGSDFEGQVHKQFQLSQLADVFCFEALVPQGANPESASPPTDSRRSGHFREGMERIPQKHTHTEEKVTSGQASGRCCTQGHDCTLSSLGGSSPTTAQKQLHLLRIFGQDLLSWRPRLTPALNTNMTCTQTTEKCFLVTASFNSQVPNKSLNCKVSNLSHADPLDQCSHEHPKSHAIFLTAAQTKPSLSSRRWQRTIWSPPLRMREMNQAGTHNCFFRKERSHYFL